MYMWLAYQFPQNFPDAEEAIVAREQCSDVIDEGLKIMSERSARSSKKRNKDDRTTAKTRQSRRDLNRVNRRMI
jgi:hypothetical protein